MAAKSSSIFMSDMMRCSPLDLSRVDHAVPPGWGVLFGVGLWVADYLVDVALMVDLSASKRGCVGLWDVEIHGDLIPVGTDRAFHVLR